VTNWLDRGVGEITGRRTDVRWSVCIRDGDGDVLAAADPSLQLPTASVGKLLLLAEVARRLEDDPALARVTLHRSVTPAVGEAGLWQHLLVDDLPVADAALLVAACSDNWATNVLLELIGLDAVGDLGASLGLRRTALLDGVRNERRPGIDPPHLSVGSAEELSGLMSRMAARTLVTPAVSERVEAWLATNADLSMVASPLGLDPLAHVEPDLGLLLRHKTGTDAGTKADVGVLRSDRATVAYAAIAQWDPGCTELRGVVDEGMGGIGRALLRYVR
jgi:beta-lactamase class A